MNIWLIEINFIKNYNIMKIMDNNNNIISKFLLKTGLYLFIINIYLTEKKNKLKFVTIQNKNTNTQKKQQHIFR